MAHSTAYYIAFMNIRIFNREIESVISDLVVHHLSNEEWKSARIFDFELVANKCSFLV